MKTSITYPFVALAVLLVVLSSCGKHLNKRVTLWRNDKIPYGTFYAHENLPHIFRDALIETSRESPVSFYDDEESSSAYIIVSYTVEPDEKELKAILNHAIAGNHVFISALNIGKNLLDSFDLEYTDFSGYLLQRDSLTISLTKRYDDSIPFTYPGYQLANHFTKMDSTVTKVLGKDEEGRANFVKFSYEGGGTVYIHLAPAAFTNFFLLHKQNKKYYDLALGAIPDSVNTVRWDEYYRYHRNGENNAERSAFSKLGTFLNNEVLRWAFWLTILLFGIIYLIESKRKQRPIPALKKLNNSSLDFVKTIGRLYYQRKDNKNLAQKIAAHFLGHIRTRYNLVTSQLDEVFEEKLAYKSGRSVVEVKEIIDSIRSLELQYDMNDDELLAFNEKIDKFINKA